MAMLPTQPRYLLTVMHRVVLPAARQVQRTLGEAYHLHAVLSIVHPESNAKLAVDWRQLPLSGGRQNKAPSTLCTAAWASPRRREAARKRHGTRLRGYMRVSAAGT